MEGAPAGEIISTYVSANGYKSSGWETHTTAPDGMTVYIEVYLEPSVGCEEGAHETLEYCPDGSEKRWRDCINGQWVYGSRECPTEECEEGETKIISYCPPPYDEYIRRYQVCENGIWIDYYNECPECDSGDIVVSKYCPDGTPEIWKECVDGRWIHHSKECEGGECLDEGAHETLEYCPDGSEKRWRDCINGQWVYGSRECEGGEVNLPLLFGGALLTLLFIMKR